MIIEIHDVWLDAAGDHETFLKAAVDTALKVEKNRTTRTSAAQREVYAFVEKHLHVLTDAKNTDFSTVIADYVARFPAGSKLRKAALPILKRIFDYDSFSRERTGWGAYALCGLARYKVCPYCHIRRTETVLADADGAGYRPQLDHYHDKARYPFLALSLGNLVPCCGTCNGPGMKHMKDFGVQPHLNPLCDAGAISFALKPAKGAPWTELHRAFRLPADMFEVFISVPSGDVKAANSLRTFQLRKQYQHSVLDALRVAKLGHSQAFLRSVAATTGLDVYGMSVEDHLGFDPASDGYKKCPEGKMRLDVYAQAKEWADTQVARRHP